jgi:hypothetical protein
LIFLLKALQRERTTKAPERGITTKKIRLTDRIRRRNPIGFRLSD